jgi:hypothetical protein
LVLVLLLSGASCNPIVIVGYLDATVTPKGDTTGQASLYAYINFTEFRCDLVQGNLQMTFLAPDPDGSNEMVLVLAGSGDGLSAGKYTIDGTGANSFNASIVIRNAGGADTFTLTSTTGWVDLKAIESTKSGCKGAQGSYKVNIAGGGVGQGTFTANVI